MAHILSVLLAITAPMAQAQSFSQIKHVLAGQEYQAKEASSSSRQAKATSSGLCQQIAEDKYQDCSTDAADNTVLYNFTTEDIEKKENISFSAPQYTNKVLLVVNLASF